MLQEVAFLGGCTTRLLITDNYSKEAVRYTDDVDLVTHVVGYPGWLKFQKRIRERGFKESMEDNINCRMGLLLILCLIAIGTNVLHKRMNIGENITVFYTILLLISFISNSLNLAYR